jgi:hypothetical protein
MQSRLLKPDDQPRHNSPPPVQTVRVIFSLCCILGEIYTIKNLLSPYMSRRFNAISSF